MNPQQERDLKDLRTAAQNRNQEQLQFMLKRLLQHLDFYVALAIPLEQIHSLLDTFEDYYPEETWVRKLVIAIGAYGTVPDDKVAEMALQQQFSAPGMGNFLKAVYDLTQAMQSKHTGEARISFMTSAVVNCIMATLADAWYGKHPIAWEKVQNSERNPETGTYIDPKANTIAYTFWMSAETAARDTELWLAIADSIELKYTRLGSAKS